MSAAPATSGDLASHAVGAASVHSAPAMGLATGGLPSDETLDRAHAAGCDRVELGLRWDRSELLAPAARVVSSCAARGLQPVVVLHVGGPEEWTPLDAPIRFARWAAAAAAALGDCRVWTPLARPNATALRRLRARRPSTRDLLRALDHQMAAHVLAAEAIRGAVDGAVITCSLAPHRLYELDLLLLDALLAPAAGVERGGVGPFLRERRRLHDEAQGTVSPRHRLERRAARSAIPLEQALPRTLAVAYAAGATTLDRIRRSRPSTLPPAVGVPLEIDDAPGDDEAADAAAAEVVWRSDADRARPGRVGA